MRTGITSLASAVLSALVILTTATGWGGAAAADPNQDEQFLASLEQKHIPAVDGIPALIARAHQICGELDAGTSFQVILDEEANNVYQDNPLLRLVPARVNSTSVRFITAAVDTYCPYHHDMLP